jgi:LmbE family N-acetylglucosaminyl deacetylase
MPTLMLVGAHPDDIAIFWGGAAARHADEGWTVVGVTVDNGAGSPHSFEMDKESLVARRAEELAWEAMRLGYRREHFALPGVKTSATRAEAVRRLTALFAADAPQRVITHHLEEHHATHAIVAKLVLRALVDAHAGGAAMPELWLGDGWEPVHYPDLRFDVTAYMNVKMAAIAMHGSQIYDTPYLMGAWGLNLYRAGFASSHEVTDPKMVFAEAYQRVEPEDVAELAAAQDPEP